MWKIKRFKTLEEQKAWIAKNGHRYQITVLFINNGYGVECRKLRRIY